MMFYSVHGKKLGVSSKKGFTLIELLVVIAIIALLVSILLPSLQSAKELAKRAVCATNLHSAGTVLFMYTSDFNGAFPSGKGDDNVYGWNGAVGYNYLTPIGSAGQRQIDPYVEGNASIFFCPGNKDTEVWEPRREYWNNYDDNPGGDICYFAWCGREYAEWPAGQRFTFLPNSPMSVETADTNWWLMGDLCSETSAIECYNSHGVTEGGNWLSASGGVEWFDRADIDGVHTGNKWLHLLYPVIEPEEFYAE